MDENDRAVFDLQLVLSVTIRRLQRKQAAIFVFRTEFAPIPLAVVHLLLGRRLL